MTVTAQMFRQHATASLSSSPGSSSPPVWLPRGIAGLSTDSSSSIASMDPSVIGSAASSTPTASSATNSSGHTHQQQQMGSAGSVRSASSAGAASSVTANGVAGSLVCRGLPVPGLVMGPLVGRGSYGRVYRGLLKGQPVAVKVGLGARCAAVHVG
jgi:hypothetical protein